MFMVYSLAQLARRRPLARQKERERDGTTNNNVAIDSPVIHAILTKRS